MTPTKIRYPNRRLDLALRRAGQRVHIREVWGPAELQFAARRCRQVSGRPDTRHCARTFHELEPATGRWRCP